MDRLPQFSDIPGLEFDIVQIKAMIYFRENVSRRLMNSVEIRNEMLMARCQRLFLQDLTEPQNITQRVAQIMARSAYPSAQELASAGSGRLGEIRVA